MISRISPADSRSRYEVAALVAIVSGLLVCACISSVVWGESGNGDLAVFLLGSAACAVFGWRHGRLLRGVDPDSEAGAIPLSLVVLLLCYAWLNRFLQDDAYISFRYAAHWASGEGLVWNSGEPPIEGYSNPLWTWVLAGFLWLGWSPEASSLGIGLCCYVGTLVLIHRIGLRVFRSRRIAMLSVVLGGANYTFSAYATGGLETQLQVMLLLGFCDQLWRGLEPGNRSLRSFFYASLLAAGAVLTRLDSILPLAILLCVGGWQLAFAEEWGRSRGQALCALILPGLLIGIVYAGWKLSVYGTLLPNTYWVKVDSGTSLRRGLAYVFRFFGSYGWLPFLILLGVRMGALRRESRGSLVLLSVIVSWLAYVIWIGGCFMEFRLLVLIIPFLAMLLVVALAITFSPLISLSIVLGLLGMSAYHQAAFRGGNGLESIAVLQSNLTEERWELIGEQLGALFGEVRPGVTIATTAAGAIPYFSGLRTIDMHGLNDAWVARHGVVESDRPGHQRKATMRYLLEQKVNFVVGNPEPLPVGTSPERYWWHEATFAMAQPLLKDWPLEAEVIEIPLDEGWAIRVLYLVRTDALDAHLEALGLRRFPIRPIASASGGES